jgi:hypothetical protein
MEPLRPIASAPTHLRRGVDDEWRHNSVQNRECILCAQAIAGQALPLPRQLLGLAAQEGRQAEARQAQQAARTQHSTADNTTKSAPSGF